MADQTSTGSQRRLQYIVITPARDEARFIELTVASMLAQTVLPLKWVIVSDGSTDGTDEIVSKYLPEHPWMELVRMPERRDRHFAGKVNAFNAGYERVKAVAYDVVCSMDADISFDAAYFEFLHGALVQVLGDCGHAIALLDRKTRDRKI